MKPDSIIIADRPSAIEAIKGLGEEDLRFLNRLIVERLKLLSQAKSTVLMAEFSTGDRVRFTSSEGRTTEGWIVRLNKKTVSIDTDDGHQWRVPPGLLRKLSPSDL
ncbi:MAG: hypothetical protein HQ519_01015 [Planctomycetes bacterium]|nr:hypothetical protein [Planctomycetota bacterium]